MRRLAKLHQANPCSTGLPSCSAGLPGSQLPFPLGPGVVRPYVTKAIYFLKWLVGCMAKPLPRLGRTLVVPVTGSLQLAKNLSGSDAVRCSHPASDTNSQRVKKASVGMCAFVEVAGVWCVILYLKMLWQCC